MRSTTSNGPARARLFFRAAGICSLMAAWMLAAWPAPASDGRLPAARAKSPVEAQAFDLEGNPVDPLAATNTSVTVLVFAGCECPISNRYAPELRRLHDKFSPRGVRFWIVYPDADTTAEQIRRHVREFSLAGAPVRDPRLWLARKSKVTVTPEGAVFNAAGRLMYHGRIDDRVVDFGKERPAPTQRDLHDAIEAVLAGKKPHSASTAAIGCRIPDLR